MIHELLSRREVPALRSREEMLELLQREVYGYLPPKPESLEFRETAGEINNFCAGKVDMTRVEAVCVLEGREFSFPFWCVIPKEGGKHPFFVNLNFRPDVPDRYIPVEELVDNGYGVISAYYQDITTDDGDWDTGIAPGLCPNRPRKATDPGKIAMWAWALHRMLDYCHTKADVLDLQRSVVCGHSRLGKTALVAAATDTRFAFSYSNDSGCSGAAISRGKDGEHIREICSRFPYWFCENYLAYVDREAALPLDQHFLLASIAPRCVLVGSGSEDLWADPVSEFLSCVAAAPAFPGGFAAPDRLPEVGEGILNGRIGYHLRKGPHYFGRADWHRLMEFVAIHTAET